MKAKKKPLQKLTPEELKVSIQQTIETIKVEEPPKRVGGAKVADVDEVRVGGICVERREIGRR